MKLPFFYISQYDTTQKEIVLDEDTSKHVVQVLRMKPGEQINLTDGKGSLLTCEIYAADKKHCAVKIIGSNLTPHTSPRNKIAISLLKNTNRFEWFLEKATELGISEIIPLLCDRTEKEKFRYDRMQGIIISAMLQSQQTWLPILHEPVVFDKAIINSSAEQKYIAHCDDGAKDQLTNKQIDPRLNDSVGQESTIILIGPEGDFTPAEIQLALENNFIPVSLGNTRLRTETAGIVAAVLLNKY